MIKKTSSGYVLKSESGKNLSKKDLNLQEAKKRKQVVEYFKHKGKR